MAIPDAMTRLRAIDRVPHWAVQTCHFVLVVIALLVFLPGARAAVDDSLFRSLVTVQPVWPGHAQAGESGPPSASEPEGTAVAIAAGGYLVTALHVVERASEISIRTADGRVMPAALVARDAATDLALLKIEADLPVLPRGPEPGLGEPVCALGNPYGTGLSVSCGVVSGLHRTGMGFNAIEDFIQTDAAINPGMSGGALVDGEGRLVGVLLAIFTGQSDSDIGINFAASLPLVVRVIDDLLARGTVAWSRPGFGVVPLTREERRTISGAKVRGVLPGGPAAAAGLQRGDIVTRIGERRIHKASDVTAAIQLAKPGSSLTLAVTRENRSMTLDLSLPLPGS